MATETREDMLKRWNTPPQVNGATKDGHGEPQSVDPYAPQPPQPVIHDVSPASPNRVATR